MFQQTEEFNKTIIGIDRVQGHELDKDEYELLTGFFLEEIREFGEAWAANDLVLQVDALMDLIYFAGGGLVRLGVVSKKSELIFDAIHQHNMKKKKGRKETREIVGDTDAIKPENWVSPEAAIEAILKS